MGPCIAYCLCSRLGSVAVAVPAPTILCFAPLSIVTRQNLHCLSPCMEQILESAPVSSILLQTDVMGRHADPAPVFVVLQRCRGNVSRLQTPDQVGQAALATCNELIVQYRTPSTHMQSSLKYNTM